MKKFLFILSLFICILSNAQKIDTIIDAGIYKSYFSYEVKQPIMVTYTLFQGGGEVSRYGMNFINDTKIKMLTGKDYAKSGYDKGHMVPAEDFAYNEEKQEKTFRYYNCVAQSPELNRGPWKKYETKARKISQLSTLLIICYNVYGTDSAGTIRLAKECYKAVYEIKTIKKKKTFTLVFAVGFKNDSTAAELIVSPTIMSKFKAVAK